MKYESAGFSRIGDSDSVMPVTKGMVGKHTVDALRDTGCSGVVVSRELVVDSQLTGGHCMLTTGGWVLQERTNCHHQC